MHFTPDQQQTIDARNPHLLVSAAAGSGKTAVMVERIVSLLCKERLHIDRMLIVTFTKAAASELRQRLESRLMQACEAFPFLQQEVESLQNAQISTLHSYCTQVIKRNFQYCEIDPLFQTAQNRQRDKLLEDSLIETLDKLYEQAQENETLLTLTQTFDQQPLTDMLFALFQYALSRPNPCAWLASQKTAPMDANTFAQSPMASVLLKEIHMGLAYAQEVLREQYQRSDRPDFIPIYLKTIQSDAELFDNLAAASQKGLQAFSNVLTSASFARMGSKRNLTEEETQTKLWYQSSRQNLKDWAEKIKELFPSDWDVSIAEMNTMLPCLHALCDSAIMLYQIFQKNKRESGVLDFSDLEHLAHHVLQNETLRISEANLFDAIFVDEYQDVSSLQEAILNALKRSHQAPFYFYVGDVKQSIYRFRQAEPTLFLEKLANYETDQNALERKISLNQNFRSRTSVLSAVNRVFALHMDAGVTEIDYDNKAALHAGLPTAFDPITELHIVNKTGKRSADLPALEAQIIAEDILKTIGTPTYDADGEPNGTLHYRDMAILMPKVKKTAQIVEEVLKQQGIPVYNESQTDAYQSDEVVQLYQFCTLLCNLHNDIAMVSVLRSTLFEMTDQNLADIRNHSPAKEISFVMAVENYANSGVKPSLKALCQSVFDYLENERFLLQSMPLSDYLWHFLQTSGLYAHYATQPSGKHRQANLRMICHQAMDYESHAMDGLPGFLETISENSTVSDCSAPATINPWEDVVRILSIHKSKGLEFPTVYVMGMGESVTRSYDTTAISMDHTLGVAVGYLNPTLRTKRSTFHQKVIAFQKRNKDLSERLRLLYVALTRPKNRLVMIGSTTEKRFSYEIARDLQMQNEPMRKNPLRIRSAQTYLDWLIQSVSPHDFLVSPDKTSSTNPQWIPCGKMTFSTQSTVFTQKTMSWRVLFHNPVSTKKFSTSKTAKNLPLLPTIPQTFENPKDPVLPPDFLKAAADPLLPFMPSNQQPLKLGVSALVRSMETPTPFYGENDSNEIPEEKRMPITQQPYPKPSFMNLEKEDLGVTLGTYTHLLLSELPLDALRACEGMQTKYRALVKSCIAKQVEIGKIQASAAPLIKLAPIIRFLQSDLGTQWLASNTSYREYAFTLQVQNPFPTILQGVIDLCFLHQNAWVLIDFKTDRLRNPSLLLARYEKQLHFYQQALETLTPYPVKTCGLYALSLGEFIPLTQS